tara:strand:- start:432 stop:824 length:393 start_codon:yes stop_codon:yes gene_type:complete
MMLILGSILGLTAIAFGAYIEHGLQASLSAEQLHAVSTALRYQQLHAVIICVLALAKESHWRVAKYVSLQIANVFFILGTLLFSGSIYLATWLPQMQWSKLAPFGGSLLMLAWLTLSWTGYTLHKDRRKT